MPAPKRGEKSYGREAAEQEQLRSPERERIERLFEQAAKDRSKTFELKQELDRLGRFTQNEDRSLNLFKKPDRPCSWQR